MADDEDGRDGGPNGDDPLSYEESDGGFRLALDRWLEGRSHEDAVLLAARTTLRLAPFLAEAERLPIPDAEVGRSALLFPFRAISAAWTVALLRTRNAHLDRPTRASVAEAANASHSAAAVLDHFTHNRSIPSAVADAATAAADAAYANEPGSSGPSRALFHATDIGDALGQSVGSMFADDYVALRDGVVAWDLACRPLWLRRAPRWQRERVSHFRNLLQKRLPESEQWWVWADWFEARWRGIKSDFNPGGSVLDPQLELKRVLIPDEVWNEGPKAVNAEIARLIEQHTGQKGPRDVTTHAGEDGLETAVGERPLNEAVNAVLQSPLLLSAYSDFQRDPETGRIQSVPFQSGVPPAGSRNRESWRDSVGAVAVGARAIVADLRAEGTKNVPEGFRLNLDRLGRAAGAPEQELNGRLVVLYGEHLLGDLVDEDTTGALPKHLMRRLEGLAALYRETRDQYYAEDRAALKDVHSLTEDVPPEQVEEAIEGVVETVFNADWEEADAPPADMQELVRENLATIRATRMREALKAAGTERERLTRERNRMEVSTLATVARFSLITGTTGTLGAGLFYAPTVTVEGLSAAGSIFGLPLTVLLAAYPEETRGAIRQVFKILGLLDEG